MKKKAIFDLDPVTKKRRTDVIFAHEGLPTCTHVCFALDVRDNTMKCINCEMEFWFQSEKQFDKMSHRFVNNWNFKLRKQVF